MPFYDGSFLETIISGPIDAFLRHRFYHQWLKRFPREIFELRGKHIRDMSLARCQIHFRADSSGIGGGETPFLVRVA